MVRFKNRWLLVEFIFPDKISSDTTNRAGPSQPKASVLIPSGSFEDDEMTGIEQHAPKEQDDDEGSDTEPDDPTSLPASFYTFHPSFMLTKSSLRMTNPQATTTGIGVPNSMQRPSKMTTTGAEGGNVTPGSCITEKQIWIALKASVMDNFGDAGWGKVGSNMAVKYYSPTTSLCIIRVARDHFRTVWGALTFLNDIGGERVVCRVVHCSGTIKKLQLAAIRYSRQITAVYLAHAVESIDNEMAKDAELRAWRDRENKIADEIRVLDE